jgi:hypothetical protein
MHHQSIIQPVNSENKATTEISVAKANTGIAVI